MTRIRNILEVIGEDRCQEIVTLYKDRHPTPEIARNLSLPLHWIRKVLLENNIPFRNRANYMKWNPTEEEKSEAINLYTVNKRGVQYIAAHFKTSWECVNDYFVKWGVKKISRSDLQLANRVHYGPTKGFSGKKHTSASRKQISKSLKKNCNRKSTGPKSQFIKTSVGKVQGSFEVAFLQKCINGGSDLPITGSTLKTPYGLYYPDFEYPNEFIEIKSPFTWDVCRGIRENAKGIKSNVQHKKIKWVDKNVKPVKVVVLDEKEAESLFRQAIKNKSLVLDDITWKRGRYYKNEPIPWP